MCHNKYAQNAPYLRDLYQRSTLLSGKAVSDLNVAEHIKRGSAAMPAFGTTLSDSEIASLHVSPRGEPLLTKRRQHRASFYHVASGRLSVHAPRDCEPPLFHCTGVSSAAIGRSCILPTCCLKSTLTF